MTKRDSRPNSYLFLCVLYPAEKDASEIPYAPPRAEPENPIVTLRGMMSPIATPI